MDLRDKKLAAATRWAMLLLCLFFAVQTALHSNFWGAAGFACGALFYAALIWREFNRRPKKLSD
jgi:O-antigen/teichoic acid export membrane protein